MRHYPNLKDKISKHQDDALHSVIRTLELRNDYDEADDLKRAFKIEMDNLRSPTRQERKRYKYADEE